MLRLMIQLATPSLNTTTEDQHMAFMNVQHIKRLLDAELVQKELLANYHSRISKNISLP